MPTVGGRSHSPHLCTKAEVLHNVHVSPSTSAVCACLRSPDFKISSTVSPTQGSYTEWSVCDS